MFLHYGTETDRTEQTPAIHTGKQRRTTELQGTARRKRMYTAGSRVPGSQQHVQKY